MSRLQSHQQKEFVKKLIFYLIILCVVLFFMLSWGLKFLINASLFISGIGSSKKTAEPLEKKDTFFGNVEVDTIPTATNSAQFFISGSVLNFDKLEFYINDEKVKDLDVSSADNFSEKIGNLTKGDNEVYVKAISAKTKNEKKTQTYTVTYKADKPKLEISEPSDNAKVSNRELTVAGKTDKEIFIRINNAPVVVDANGSFRTTVFLNEGENKITISATDLAGNEESKTLTVQYQKDE